MPQERFLALEIHQLLSYLNQQGVLTILVMAQHGLVGVVESPIDLSYLSDAVLLLRFFEAQGKVRKAISVLKKRVGTHEDTIRELPIDGPRAASRRASDRLPRHHVRNSDLCWIAADIKRPPMTHTDEAAFRSRVLILAPVGRDAALTGSLLDRGGVESVGVLRPAPNCSETSSRAPVPPSSPKRR